MAIGPVQLIVRLRHPGVSRRDHRRAGQLRESDTVRVIDSLAVYKDADGELEVEHLSNLTEQKRSSSAARSALWSASASRARRDSRPAPKRAPRRGHRRRPGLFRRGGLGRA